MSRLRKPYDKLHYQKNKAKYAFWSKKSELKRIMEWGKIIPQETQCQICDKKIYYHYTKKREETIHFDHRHGAHNDNYFPSQFLIKTKRTPETEKLWLSYDFGMLCGRCNRALPTVNREDWVKRVNKYVFNA